MIEKYPFYNIFSYNSDMGVITPLYDVIINGVRFNQGAPLLRSTSFGGLNLFNYIGRDIAGTWDQNNRALTISGFY